jgi:hypothetical protein
MRSFSNKAKTAISKARWSTAQSKERFALTFHRCELSDPIVFIIVTDPGNRVVSFRVPYLQLPSNKKMFSSNHQANVQFPYRLKKKECCQV